jgi:hypothetical protein
MQLKLLSSVCAVALGLAFAPGAWAQEAETEKVVTLANEGSNATTTTTTSSSENEFEADESFNTVNHNDTENTSVAVMEDSLNTENKSEVDTEM